MSALTTAEIALIAQDFAERYRGGYVGVGTGTDEEDPELTDLTGTSVRAPVTSVTVIGTVATFYASFGEGVANFQWNEAGLFADAAGGHMAVRQVIDSPGTKSGQTWVYGLAVELAPAE